MWCVTSEEKKKRRRKKRRVTGIVLCGVILGLFLGCLVYVRDYYHADELAQATLVSSETVKVEQVQNDRIVFLPDEPAAGLIFYPGGKVEYTAYAPLLHSLAEQGVLCVLVRMPWNLAVLDIDAAEGIQEEFPEISTWYIGGHSLGGSMAGSYGAEHAKEFQGLILLAAYVTEDLRQSGLKVLSVYGSEDQVLNRETYTENLTNLPEDREEHVIEGGCHAQFGSYGEQRGDGIPEISGQEQRELTVGYIMEWLKE